MSGCQWPATARFIGRLIARGPSIRWRGESLVQVGKGTRGKDGDLSVVRSARDLLKCLTAERPTNTAGIGIVMGMGMGPELCDAGERIQQQQYQSTHDEVRCYRYEMWFWGGFGGELLFWRFARADSCSSCGCCDILTEYGSNAISLSFLSHFLAMAAYSNPPYKLISTSYRRRCVEAQLWENNSRILVYTDCTTAMQKKRWRIDRAENVQATRNERRCPAWF